VECAVVGLSDDDFGQKIAAVVVLKKGKTMTLESLREWGKSRMANYKIPRQLFIYDTIPRNAMGKINKKELIKVLTSPA
jgi:malonyl-CoA/methylmalonyl-CoA synthetase